MKLVPTIVGVALLAGLLFGLNALVAARTRAAQGDAAEAPARARALPVETARITPRESIEVQRTFTGTVDARRRAELSFEGTGRIERILVDEGESVSANDVLAVLDTQTLGAQRAEIESRRVALQARLDELVAGPRREVMDAARADVAALEKELELAKVQRTRRAGLAERGSISSEQLDTSETLVLTLEARLDGARARLAELENGTRAETLAAQRGALGEVDAALASIDIQIDKATLRAPFAGTIAARYLDEGAVVSNMMPQPAFSLVETGALEARVGVPSDLVDGVISGASDAAITVRGATVGVARRRPLPTVDAGTRTVPVVFEVDAASAADAGVRPGDVVTMTLTVERAERGAWIPLAALSESTRGLWSAYVAEPDESGTGTGTHRARRIELEVLDVQRGRAFVRGTIDASMLVVVSGSHRIVPGQSVVLAGEPAELDAIDD